MPTVLDLTRLPRRLGFFEQQSDSGDRDRHAIQFLHRFVKSLAMKVERGEREHINYVPTQVVTEWFRRVCNEIRMATGADPTKKVFDISHNACNSALGSIVPPGKGIWASEYTDHAATSIEVRQWNSIEGDIVVFGRYDYTDSFGAQYFSQFCMLR